MLHPSTRKLIDRLAQMTERGKLAWSEGEDGTLNYVTEGYAVALISSPNELVITTKDGKELERATVEELNATSVDDGDTYAAIVAAMTMEASRIARGTETAIDTLLANIETEDDTSDEPSEDVDLVLPADVDAATEDDANDSASLSAEEIADLDVSAETDEQPEAYTPEDVEEITVTEAGTEEETLVETTVSTDDDASDQETITEIAADVPTPDTPEVEQITYAAEAEPDMTEAVQRLAAEVNQRESSMPDMATAGTTALGAIGGAVAAEVVTTDTEEATEPPVEITPVEENREEAVVVATEAVADETQPISTVAGDENHAYVPFGLESASSEAPTEPEANVTLSMPSDEPEFTATEIDADPALETPDPESVVTTAIETVEDAASDITEAASETVAEVIDATTAMASDGVETSMEQAEATISDVSDAGEAIVQTANETANTAVEVANDAVSETVDTVSDITADVSEAVDSAVSTITESTVQPQSYSLSGIGAGFGLGALTSKTEATGAPPASSEVEPERIIIDATDDIQLSQPEPAPVEAPLPEIADLPPAPEAAPVDTASESETGDQTEAPAEDDPLKPRTRFNPWN